MKLMYLIGLPGCGKTTIMKQVIESLGDFKIERPIELLDSHFNGSVRILGKYQEGETFSGTDRLSMAVAPKAIEYFSTRPDEIVLGEGDRLNNSAFFDCFDNKTIVHLTVSDEERKRRYEERGSEQSDKFIQTVRTKVKNVVEKYGDQSTLFGIEEGCVVDFVHENEEDTQKVVNFILKTIREK